MNGGGKKKGGETRLLLVDISGNATGSKFALLDEKFENKRKIFRQFSFSQKFHLCNCPSSFLPRRQ